MFKRILWGALVALCLVAPAFGQSSVLPYYYNSSGVKTAVGTSNPLPVTAGSGGLGTVSIGDGTTSPVAVKPASTAALATDKSFVVQLNPLSPGITPLGPAAVSSSLPVALSSQYPTNGTTTTPEGITGNAAGSTSAVVGTLSGAASKTTFICGFNVQAIGGTATVGPITIAGLVGSSQVYQTDVNSATVGKEVAKATFNPCIPASATNTSITITTTANGSASAVNVNSWGYRL